MIGAWVLDLDRLREPGEIGEKGRPRGCRRRGGWPGLAARGFSLHRTQVGATELGRPSGVIGTGLLATEGGETVPLGVSDKGEINCVSGLGEPHGTGGGTAIRSIVTHITQFPACMCGNSTAMQHTTRATKRLQCARCSRGGQALHGGAIGRSSTSLTPRCMASGTHIIPMSAREPADSITVSPHGRSYHGAAQAPPPRGSTCWARTCLLCPPPAAQHCLSEKEDTLLDHAPDLPCYLSGHDPHPVSRPVPSRLCHKTCCPILHLGIPSGACALPWSKRRC